MTRSRIETEAARWLIELDSTEDTERLWPDFDSWLGQDPEHRRVYARIERAWRALGKLRSMRSTESMSGAVPCAAPEGNAKPTRRKALLPAAIIAAIAAAILTVLAVVSYI
jgi:ferric-dicitrate binding protein FerR (iron transport regulator)